MTIKKVSMTTKRYVISDGTYYLTGATNFVREPSLALKFIDKDAAERKCAYIQHLVGTSFKVVELKGRPS